jgi:hypothetical protein
MMGQNNLIPRHPRKMVSLALCAANPIERAGRHPLPVRFFKSRSPHQRRWPQIH